MKHRVLVQTLFVVVAGCGIANAQIPNFTPPTPLIGAIMHNDAAEVERLLAKGADPNEGRMMGFSPVLLSVVYQNKDIFHAMAAKGANIHELDPAGDTILMWAAGNEHGDPELVKELMKAGVDPLAVNKMGETAWTWASRRGATRIVEVLTQAGASNQPQVREAAQKAVNVLQKSGTQFIRVSGCVSCHHTFLPQMASVIARGRGLTVDENAMQLNTNNTIGMIKPFNAELASNPERLPDPPVTVSYGLLALAADRYSADETTDAMAQTIAKWQHADGGFNAFPMRPPIEANHFAATALSLRAMQLYGKNSEERVARAADWLRINKPMTTEDAAMRLMGMSWASLPVNELQAAVDSILKNQRPDGGWAQLPGLETDAYATGQTLVTLKWSGLVKPSDPAYQRGIGFLLRTQFADGSWLVRTRTFPVQPYKESGFPFAKDQWISATGTSWAAMALTLALPEQSPSASLAAR